MDSLYLILVHNLPKDVKELDLLEIVKPYGKVDSIQIKKSLLDEDSASATITYEDGHDAEMTKSFLTSTHLHGRSLIAELIAPEETFSPKPVVSAPTTAQVHFSYLTKQTEDVVSPDTIKSIFEHFGPVLSVVIKKSFYDLATKHQNGYGFVHFPLSDEGISAALKSVEMLNHVTINQVNYDCSISRQTRQLLPPHWQNDERLMGDNHRKKKSEGAPHQLFELTGMPKAIIHERRPTSLDSYTRFSGNRAPFGEGRGSYGQATSSFTTGPAMHGKFHPAARGNRGGYMPRPSFKTPMNHPIPTTYARPTNSAQYGSSFHALQARDAGSFSVPAPTTLLDEKFRSTPTSVAAFPSNALNFGAMTNPQAFVTPRPTGTAESVRVAFPQSNGSFMTIGSSVLPDSDVFPSLHLHSAAFRQDF